ncbi:MAG TPA: DUF389 domain-containing protein [Verrucomicrobiae bacterium]|nr:DUF389 domain-containing protein [Verrucomicrobiae bacterium]
MLVPQQACEAVAALLPPLATTGLLLGSRQFGSATGAMRLFLTNPTCIRKADCNKRTTGFACALLTALTPSTGSRNRAIAQVMLERHRT